MTILKPEVRATEYAVSCLPEGHPDGTLFTITVEYRGNGRWAVKRAGAFYDADGNRSWGSQWEDGREPVTDAEMAAYEAAHQEWLDRHRFDEKTALELAQRLASGIDYRGYALAKALAAHERKEGGPLL